MTEVINVIHTSCESELSNFKLGRLDNRICYLIISELWEALENTKNWCFQHDMAWDKFTTNLLRIPKQSPTHVLTQLKDAWQELVL